MAEVAKMGGGSPTLLACLPLPSRYFDQFSFLYVCSGLTAVSLAVGLSLQFSHALRSSLSSYN